MSAGKRVSAGEHSGVQFQAGKYSIIIDIDPTFTVNSADNVHIYDHEYALGEREYKPSSRYSLRVYEQDTEIASCILLARGGATGIHEHSALVNEDCCIVAIGPFLCSLELPSLLLVWHSQVDSFTCFGVYHSQKHGCYLTHGELEIARVSYGGDLVWHQGSRDIFTGDFELHDDDIQVADWNGDVYHMNISSGNSRLITI